MNRIDKVVVFNTLQSTQLKKVLEIEMMMVQERILNARGEGKFIFKCSQNAKEFLLSEGTDLKYGARHLKRALERYLVYPLSNLVATSQVSLGDLVRVDFDSRRRGNSFSQKRSMAGSCRIGITLTRPPSSTKFSARTLQRRKTPGSIPREPDLRWPKSVEGRRPPLIRLRPHRIR